ncbi:MAG: hypothetical protein AABZ36_07110 [Nitrospirota bacterium]
MRTSLAACLPDYGMAPETTGDRMTNVTGGKAIFEKSVIEKILGIPFNEDNYVRLLKSGEETFHAIFESAADAKEIICIEFYIFKDDDTGRKFAELLKEKAQKGIKV